MLLGSQGRGSRALQALMVIGIAATATSPSSVAWAQTKYDLTMGIIVSPGDAYTAMTASVPERIQKATNGRVSITVERFTRGAGADRVGRARRATTDVGCAAHLSCG